MGDTTLKFKKGDKIRIKPNKSKWYKCTIPYLNSHTGVLEGFGEGFAQVVFNDNNNSRYTVFSNDLELIAKNQQLLFEFMV